MTNPTDNTAAMLPITIVEPMRIANGGWIKLSSGRGILLSKVDASTLRTPTSVIKGDQREAIAWALVRRRFPLDNLERLFNRFNDNPAHVPAIHRRCIENAYADADAILALASPDHRDSGEAS